MWAIEPATLYLVSLVCHATGRGGVRYIGLMQGTWSATSTAHIQTVQRFDIVLWRHVHMAILNRYILHKCRHVLSLDTGRCGQNEAAVWASKQDNGYALLCIVRICIGYVCLTTAHSITNNSEFGELRYLITFEH